MAIIKPQRSTRGVELDMRASPNTGKELAKEIANSVEHTQQFIVQELPNWLVVSSKQFASLVNYTEEMYQTTDRLFRTPYNVMEVQVDEDLDPVVAPTTHRKIVGNIKQDLRKARA